MCSHDFGDVHLNYNSMLSNNADYTVCKESGVRQPGASGFCYWASEFCFQLARRARSFLRNSNNRRTVRSILLFKKLLG